MKIKDGVIMQGLQIVMRPALIEAERLWKQFGQEEGVTITSALDGEHSAGSLHYYGLAVDFRTHYWSPDTAKKVWLLLKGKLAEISPNFDVIYHKTHIHVEWDEK
jgi:hypothetical protein